MDKMTFWQCVKQLLISALVLLVMLVLALGLIAFAVLGIAAILSAVGGLFT